MSTLSEKQRTLLTALALYDDVPTARCIAYEEDGLGGYDLIFVALKRLERRGFVERDTRRPAHWSVTDAGREALR